MLKGPQLIEKINQDIGKWLETHNYSGLEDIRGKLHDRLAIRSKEKQFVYHAEPPVFIKDRCTSCGICERVCPYIAITMTQAEDGKKYPVIDAKKCYGCGLCISACPVFALESPFDVAK